MNSKGFVVALLLSLAGLIYVGQNFLFFSDYMAFMAIFAAASLIITVAAVVCKTTILSASEDESTGNGDR